MEGLLNGAHVNSTAVSIFFHITFNEFKVALAKWVRFVQLSRKTTPLTDLPKNSKPKSRSEFSVPLFKICSIVIERG